MKKEKKWYLVLPGLNKNNVEDIYQKNFKRWRFKYSDVLKADGKVLNESEKFLIQMSFKTDIKEVDVSDMEEGFELTEEQFINEETKHYQIIFKDSSGSSENRTTHLRAGLYLEYLKKRLEELNPSKSQSIDNPYPSIFKDGYCYKLFDSLQDDYNHSKTLLADFSYIYRVMYADGFILEQVKPEIFKKWLSQEPYKIILDTGLKTLDRCNTKDKTINYNTKKEIILKNYKNVV